MIKGLKRNVRTIAWVLLLALTISGTGCGSKTAKEPENINVVTDTTANKEEANVTVETAAQATKIDDNGKPIYDFDEFVNGEWKREQEASGKDVVSAFASKNDIITERVIDILDNIDISEMPTDSDLAKAVKFYRTFLNADNFEQRISDIKELIAPIESAKDLDDLYALYGTPEYALFDLVLNFDVRVYIGGKKSLFYYPYGDLLYIKKITETINEDSEESARINSYLRELGYSKERIDEILQNAVTIGEIIENYKNNLSDESTFIYTQTQLDNLEVNVPIISILKSRDEIGVREEFYVNSGFATFVNELFVPENVDALRDHLLFETLFSLGCLCGYTTENVNRGQDYKSDVYYEISKRLSDIISPEYLNKYAKSEEYDFINELVPQISDSTIYVIGQADWLGGNTKEFMSKKITDMKGYYFENGHKYDLNRVIISDDPIKNYIEMRKDRRKFIYGQLNVEDKDREIFDLISLENNAYYYHTLNSYILCAGLMGETDAKVDAPYEEKLAAIGLTIAHEFGHAFDKEGIAYEGLWRYRMNINERNAYIENIQNLSDYLEGKDAGYGNKISASRFVNETMADIISFQICLKILSEKENPDYDLFFRTYAKKCAQYATEKGMEEVLTDNHLPGKLRINCVLAQFDEFYETYDLDESSPYYIQKEERIKIF